MSDKVLETGVDARNEDYRRKLGLTAEQKAYDEQWLRLHEVYNGKKRRPWIVLGFKARPNRENCRGRVTYTPVALTADNRFVFPEELDVVTMSDIPAKNIKRGARHTRFNSEVLNGYTDAAGRPCVGGNDRFCVRLLDFAKPPIQDHPLFHPFGEVDRRRLTATRPGRFEVLTSDRWVDLCVGSNPEDGTPAVLYRLPNDPKILEHVKITKKGREVNVDGLLATLKEPVQFFTARLDGGGRPIVDKVGSDVLSATRGVDLFKVLLRMHTLSTDMTLLPPQKRPQVVPAEEWLPRVWFQIQGTKRPYLKEALVHERLCEGLGPRGDFAITAPCCGELLENAPVEGQDHLVEIVIKYDPAIPKPHGTRAPSPIALIDGCLRLRVPASAVMLKKVGDQVLTGQKVADYCKRIAFDSWATVEGVIGVETAMMVLDDFLERIPVVPGQFNWEGPGRLWPAELLEEVPRGARWLWDMQPALPYLNEEGTIVGPAIKQQAWDDFTFGGGSTAFFDLTPAFNRLSGGFKPEPTNQGGKKSKRGNKPRGRSADCIATRSAKAAGVDPVEIGGEIVDEEEDEATTEVQRQADCIATRSANMAGLDPAELAGEMIAEEEVPSQA